MPSLGEINPANFPPEKRWAKVEGVLFQPQSNPADPILIAIGGRDHTGAEVRFWTDLPNAMYLMNMLAQVQKELSAYVPSNPPGECMPYDPPPANPPASGGAQTVLNRRRGRR